MPHPLDLRSFEDRLDGLLAGASGDVRAALLEEHEQWHALHDRLVAIIAAFVDDAVERGEQLAPLLERVRGRTSVGVEDLVGETPSAEAVAALLRAHHSIGEAVSDGDGVTFTHQCGSGLAHWRRAGDVALVAEGEVDGVPGGVPRYCARCISSVQASGAGRWRVTPPESPVAEPCRWEVATGP